MKQLKQTVLPLLLVLLMLCVTVLPASAVSATASNMRLAQYTGTVNVTNSSGRTQSKRSNMQLYNGYNVETKAKSYAWISLDSTKLIKLDASSKVQIRKSGSKLELLLTSGHIYFNVTSPLTSDETLNIRTSTTVTGIRGTSGCINVVDRWTSEIYILEGSVQVNVTDPVSGQLKTATVESGQKAVAVAYPQEQAGDKCDFIQEQIEVNDIGGFVLEELAQDPELCREIYEASGLDVRDVTVEDARERLTRDEQELQDKLDGIGTELAQQDNNVSSDPVWEQDGSGSDPGSGTPSGGTGSGGGTSGTPGGEGSGGDIPGGGDDSGGGTPGGGDDSGSGDDTDGGDTKNSITLQLTEDLTVEKIQEYWDNGYSMVILEKNSETSQDTLTVNTDMTVPSGKTLVLPEGVGVEISNNTLAIAEGGALDVYGTLKANSIANEGALINEATGVIAADSIITSGETGDKSSGYFSSAGAIEGTVTIEGGDVVITGGKITGGSSTAVNITNGIFEVTGGEIISSSSDATVSVTGGNLNLEGGMITNSGDGYALSVSGSPEITCDGTIFRANQEGYFINIDWNSNPRFDGYTQSDTVDEDGYCRLSKTGA